MLTPQEVSERAFAKASFGGYNMAQVDEFLDQLTEDYTALYKENAVLKSKMKVLVEKVEEYRSTEDGMRKTLLAAQRMADAMVSEAEQKKETLLAEAENEARERLADYRRQVTEEQARLTAVKQETAGVTGRIRALCADLGGTLDALEGLVPAAVTAAAVAAAAEPEEEPVPEEELEATRIFTLPTDLTEETPGDEEELPEEEEEEEEDPLSIPTPGHDAWEEEVTEATCRIPSLEDLMAGFSDDED